jgi:hypothetical protein
MHIDLNLLQDIKDLILLTTKKQNSYIQPFYSLYNKYKLELQ